MFNLFYIEDITLGTDKEIYEATGRASGVVFVG